MHCEHPPLGSAAAAETKRQPDRDSTQQYATPPEGVEVAFRLDPCPAEYTVHRRGIAIRHAGMPTRSVDSPPHPHAGRPPTWTNYDPDESKASTFNGIESVKRNAPNSEIAYQTFK
jgi:hypothetical protein